MTVRAGVAAVRAPRRSRVEVGVPGVLALVVVGLQIGYPLTRGTTRDHLTVAIVVVLAATCLVHAGVTRGAGVALSVLALTAVPGLAVEVLGVHTGVPFGRYSYGTGLGASVFGVPLVVAAAWTMLAWPAALAARELVEPFMVRVLVGAWALAAADLFLDPQLVAAGQWRWHDPSPHLPGVGSVPLTNFAGWLIVALVLSFAVQSLLRIAADPPGAGDAVGTALYLWLYLGWVIALAAFLGLGAAAAWGAVGMGVVAIPLAVRLGRTSARTRG